LVANRPAALFFIYEFIFALDFSAGVEIRLHDSSAIIGALIQPPEAGG
jgi:hypothetical protein